MILSATALADTATSWLYTINWSNPSWDLFIVIFFVVASFLYGLSLGRDRIIVILVSIYMALAIINTTPFLQKLDFNININNYFVLRTSTFIVLFIVLFFLISKSALMKTLSKDDAGKWWHILLFSFLQIGLLMSTVINFLPDDIVSSLAPITRKVFTDELSIFLWLVLPVALMAMVRPKD